MKEKKDARSEFLSLIPSDVKKILDVGCGRGILCSGLWKKNIEVIGIENNEQLGLEAQKKLTKVFIADAEKFQPPFPGEYFDCILCADILEHFVDPLSFLKNSKKYLTSTGCIIASIPNVRYYKIIIRLIFGGTWDYVETGILDKTHMRFFTLMNMRELFDNAGYRVIKVERNTVAASGFKWLNFLCFNLLKDFLSYQYYIVAVKANDADRNLNKRMPYQF